jgi:protein-tyrosine phosphatase
MKPTMYCITTSSPGKLAILARPRGNEWLEDEIAGFAQAGITVVVSLLTNEEASELGLANEGDVVTDKGLEFINFPITDYNVPKSQHAVFQLVATLNDLLSDGKSVGVHCRQGIGRSSLIVACILSLTDGDIDQCFKQISAARGTTVPDTAEQREWVRTFADTFSTQTLNR